MLSLGLNDPRSIQTRNNRIHHDFVITIRSNALNDMTRKMGLKLPVWEGAMVDNNAKRCVDHCLTMYSCHKVVNMNARKNDTTSGTLTSTGLNVDEGR
jgi:hypothetical protein